MSRLLLPSALLVLLSSGCHSYLLPFDERAINAPTPIRTAGGERIDIDGGGQLCVRPGPDDVAAALGVSLFAGQAKPGLIVTNRLRSGTRLEPEDRIVHVAAVLPSSGALVRRAHRAALATHLDPEGTRDLQRELKQLTPKSLPWGNAIIGPDIVPTFDYFDPTTVRHRDKEARTKGSVGEQVRRLYGPRTPRAPSSKLPTPAELRALKAGHPVRSLADLRPYLCGVGWLHLDLLVVRGEQELVIRQRLSEESRWLPVRLWRHAETRWHGVDLVRVGTLSPETRPRRSEPNDLLVVRVARDAPLGQEGLRPLDLVHQDDASALLGWDPPKRADGKVRVRTADGRPKLIRPRMREVPTNVWIPFLLSYQSDGVRTHVGIGPFDLLFHRSKRLDYDPRTGSYEQLSRWSVGTSIQGQSVQRERGEQGSGGVNPILDVTRLQYLIDWLDAPEEQRQRTRGWR